MSASGIVENMVKHHLVTYGDELKEWYKLQAISTESAAAHNGFDTEGGTNVWILRMECGEVLCEQSGKAERCFRHPENHLARTLRCEGIRSPLVADSVSTVTKVNTLEL